MLVFSCVSDKMTDLTTTTFFLGVPIKRTWTKTVGWFRILGVPNNHLPQTTKDGYTPASPRSASIFLWAP